MLGLFTAFLSRFCPGDRLRHPALEVRVVVAIDGAPASPPSSQEPGRLPNVSSVLHRQVADVWRRIWGVTCLPEARLLHGGCEALPDRMHRSTVPLDHRGVDDAEPVPATDVSEQSWG